MLIVFSPTGIRTEQDFYVRLIDSMTKQVNTHFTTHSHRVSPLLLPLWQWAAALIRPCSVCACVCVRVRAHVWVGTHTRTAPGDPACAPLAVIRAGENWASVILALSVKWEDVTAPLGFGLTSRERFLIRSNFSRSSLCFCLCALFWQRERDRQADSGSVCAQVNSYSGDRCFCVYAPDVTRLTRVFAYASECVWRLEPAPSPTPGPGSVAHGCCHTQWVCLAGLRDHTVV